MIPRIFALLGNVTLWVGYAFAALCLALLVYSFSQDGARDVATWVITLGRCNRCHYRVRHSLHSTWTKSLSAGAANPALSRWPKIRLKNLPSPRHYGAFQKARVPLLGPRRSHIVTGHFLSRSPTKKFFLLWES